ncbi:MAG: OB-fold nucleic acid binding domain-containing protein, partial [Actinomycetota bacterium]
MTGQITLRDLAAIDVKVLKGVGDKRKAALGEYGVENVLELLMNYPRRWVDRTNEARVSDLVAGQEALVLVEVRKVSKFTTKSRKTIVKVQVGDESGRISATFFNQPWRERQLKVGLQVAMFGKVDLY